jgi:ribonuclease D
MESHVFVERADEVETLARLLAREKVIAVDTEADSFFHYFDKLCLLQIGSSEGIFLIDPLALPENGLKPLERVFASPSIRKVFHAADYDLYVLHRSNGIRVRNVFDTMISAQLLGYPAVGLGALVERHFDVRLSKDQQRTDWSRRPLRPAQIDYAASDVRYLVQLASILEEELRAKGRLEWARAEFAALEERTWPEREFDEQGYLRIKGARRLSPRGLAVLSELYLMRDRRARALDRPPFKVLGNGTLLDLAQNPPRSRRSFLKRKGITDLVMHRMGQELEEAIARGVEGPEHPPLERRSAEEGSRRRLDRRGEARLGRLKQWRLERAGALELDPGVFCPNAALEEMAAAAPAHVDELRRLPTLKRWWIDAFGKEVCTLLAGAAIPPESTDAGTTAQGEPAVAGEGVEGGAARRSRRRSRGRRRRRTPTEPTSS